MALDSGGVLIDRPDRCIQGSSFQNLVSSTALHQDLQQLVIILRKRYIAIHQYLNDWLDKQWSREKSIQDRQETLLLCQQMACFINGDKSKLNPTQQLDFV